MSPPVHWKPRLHPQNVWVFSPHSQPYLSPCLCPSSPRRDESWAGGLPDPQTQVQTWPLPPRLSPPPAGTEPS